MKWFKYPEFTPSVDEDAESAYLFVLCDRAVVPLAGYYVEPDGFFLLGCPLSNGPLKSARAWAFYPKLPAELFADSPLLLRHARSSGLIEEKSDDHPA